MMKINSKTQVRKGLFWSFTAFHPDQIPLYFNRKALFCSAAESRQPLPDLWPVVVQGNSATGSGREALSDFSMKLRLNQRRENFPLQYFKSARVYSMVNENVIPFLK